VIAGCPDASQPPSLQDRILVGFLFGLSQVLFVFSQILVVWHVGWHVLVEHVGLTGRILLMFSKILVVWHVGWHVLVEHVGLTGRVRKGVLRCSIQGSTEREPFVGGEVVVVTWQVMGFIHGFHAWLVISECQHAVVWQR